MEDTMLYGDTPEEVEVPSRESNEPAYSVVELPSQGKLGYPSEVRYRDIMVKDEKQIASATVKTFDVIINEVLKSLLKDKEYFERMSLHDRDYLLLWIWANNYSPVKEIEVECQQCSAKNQYSVDITELEVDEYDGSVELPYRLTLKDGKEIGIRPFTVGMEISAKKFCKQNPAYDEIYVMICQSMDVGRALPIKEKIEYIENNISGKDMARVRGFHSNFRFGVNNEVTKTCDSCGEVSTFSVPFQIDFFIPTLSGDFK